MFFLPEEVNAAVSSDADAVIEQRDERCAKLRSLISGGTCKWWVTAREIRECVFFLFYYLKMIIVLFLGSL